MSSQMRTKVRLVRCPRCRQLLAELPDVPLYKCGGCGTILQAKNQKIETNRTNLCSQETDPVAKTEQENEETRSNQDLTPPPSGESLPEKDDTRDQDGDGECSMERSEESSLSDEISSSLEVNGFENKNSSAEVRKPSQQDEGECLQGRNKWSGDSNFFDGSPSSSELNCHEADTSDQEVEQRVELENKIPLDQHDRRDSMEGGDSQMEWHGDENFLDEVHSLPEQYHHKNQLLPGGGENTEEVNSRSVLRENKLQSRKTSMGQENSSASITSHETENSSESSEPASEVDEDIKIRSIFRSSSKENDLNANTIDLVVASESPSHESIMSVNFNSPDDEQPEHFHSPQNFGRVSSVDTFESSPLVDHTTDLSAKHGDAYKSPITRTFYAYDGSVSSFDEFDDEIPDPISQPSRSKFEDADCISSAEKHKKSGYRVNKMLSSEPEMQYWATSSSSVLPGKQHSAMKGSNWHQDELPEKRRHGHFGGNRMRLDKEANFISPFSSTDFLADRTNGYPSSYQDDLLQHRPGFYVPDGPSYSEPDKMDLLRTIHELKDQLNRMRLSEVMENGRFPAVREEKYTPLYPDHLAPERKIHSDLNHHRYHARHGHVEGWPQQCRDLRMAFSEEAAHCRRQVNCSCSHCRPQDWHCSAQFPSHSMCCNSTHCVVQSSPSCYNAHASSSSSPQHYTSSEPSMLSYERKFDDQRYKDDEMKRLNLREKYRTAKHIRQIAGGAPLVSCYYCSELLQMPADFLLFKKKYHRLRCNACEKILKFSILKGMHIVPYVPDVSTPPPSEADTDYDPTSQRNLVPISHSNHCQIAKNVSYSGDYGLSCRSGSTEEEASLVRPSLDSHKMNAYNSKTSSTTETMEDRKMKSILRESRNKNESAARTLESAGPSSKMSKWKKPSPESEIEELPTSAGSPLHRLMGYSSISQVLE